MCRSCLAHHFERHRFREREPLIGEALDPALAVRLQMRWARLKQGWSQSELARRVGVTRQQISLLESPDSNLTLGTLEKVASALNLDLEIELRDRSVAA